MVKLLIISVRIVLFGADPTEYQMKHMPNSSKAEKFFCVYVNKADTVKMVEDALGLYLSKPYCRHPHFRTKSWL